MQRKDFLQQLASVSMGMPLIAWDQAHSEPLELTMKIPPYLKAGDTIALTSPAGYITHEEVQPAILQLESWGLKVKKGFTIGLRDGTFGGTDQQRMVDFQQMLDDPAVKAVMCARGGYGFVRIIDQLDFYHFRRNPKWLIGFSDITVLHSHLNKVVKVASVHSKMCNSFPDDWSLADPLQQATILSIRDLLFGKPMFFELPPTPYDRYGSARGELIGGNCKTIESMAGSRSDIDTTGKILFLEDTGEYLYSIDRMFWNLKRSGKLENLAGLIIGGFKVKLSEDPSEEFGKNLWQIILEKVQDCPYPVCFDFPVGHQKNNYALKCGARIKLDVNINGTVVSE